MIVFLVHILISDGLNRNFLSLLDQTALANPRISWKFWNSCGITNLYYIYQKSPLFVTHSSYGNLVNFEGTTSFHHQFFCETLRKEMLSNDIPHTSRFPIFLLKMLGKFWVPKLNQTCYFVLKFLMDFYYSYIRHFVFKEITTPFIKRGHP